MAPYISVGIFHTWLMNKEMKLLDYFWPTMEKAVNYAVGLQASGGEIFWAKSPEGKILFWQDPALYS